jgi:magnesium-transporting ATPase (P-type)
VFNEVTKKHFFVAKGAFESIRTGISDPSTLGKATLAVQESTRTGTRVLAIAYRELKDSEVDVIDAETEEYFFQNLDFLGLLNFDNAVKPSVDATMAKLTECGIDIAIVSGDNEYSCAFVAFKIGVVSQFQVLHFIAYDPISHELSVQALRYVGDKLVVEPINPQEHPLFDHINKLAEEDVGHETHVSHMSLDKSHSVISIDNAPFTLPTDSLVSLMMNGHTFDLLRRKRFLDPCVLNNTRVFARMTPSAKSDVVEAYKRVHPRHHKVGFVGDGSNDVRAMKLADIGISFVGCEASISAGFSIPFSEFGLITWVLAEGKACLEICIELFKYIVFYSLGQFSGLLILYYMNLDFSNGMYYIMDLFITVPASIVLCFHGARRLVYMSPVDTLFCKPIMLSVFGNAIILAMAMVAGGVYTYKNVWDAAVGPSNSVTIVFLIMSCDLAFILLLLVRGHPSGRARRPTGSSWVT